MPGRSDETESFSQKVDAIPPIVPEVLTAEQTAERLQVNVQTVRRWASKGRIPAGKTPDGDWRFWWPDVWAQVFGREGTADDQASGDGE